ncbi:MAG TPA: penicillin acylase family protein [Bryobacteraceae bacterium]|nr:penicillin acylase family protein [Bryobacteraceae bacterium]
MQSVSRYVVLTLGFLLALPAGAATAGAPEKVTIAGLSQPVEILKDRWGISHIYAKNETDLFFAQGYNVARDRLFQLELWRRQATGTVSEILGRRELKRDIGNRLFMYRGDLKQELNWYHPRGESIIQAFVDGVNAYISETQKNPALLTPEFKMLGITPGKWTPAVVVSRFNGLLGNIDEEMNLALAVRTIGVEKVKDLEYFQPADPDLKMDPAIDSSLLAKNILELYHAFRTPIKFVPEELAAAYRGQTQAVARLDDSVETPSAIDLSNRRQDIGSNNWVVSGKLTATGFPMMMNDPHRNQQTPSLRYWVHLVAPGWDVIGGGEPALPGVSIGHNDFGSWGLTIFGTDSEDLYVYDTNPANPNEYKYNGGWEAMTVIRESIPVKGEAAVAIDLKYTRHGPVVFEDKAHHKAYAIRAAWREVGGAPYLASLRMDQAHTWDEFRNACGYSRIPAENMVWADRNGNIGYQAVGIAPMRPNWSGLLPVPGDGRYEWDGYLPIKALPNVLNPEKGFFNTSNNYLIPPGWPYKEALHYTWADPFRGDSVEQFLRSGRMFTVSDMMQLQNNDLSIPARSLVPLLRDLTIQNAAAAQAQSRLLRWNDVLDKDSVEAGIYEMWQRHLMANVREQMVPKEVKDYIGNVEMTKIIRWLQAPDGRFGSDPIAGRDAILSKSLDEAVAELTQRFGPEQDKWKLGAYHHASIPHFMTAGLNAAERSKFDVGDLPRGGDSYTVTATGGADNQTSGGSFKIIVDTEDWDSSVGLNNPGQSGDVNDPHYRDLYQLWARGKYFPIFYSRAKVESVTEKSTQLEPAGHGVSTTARIVR